MKFICMVCNQKFEQITGKHVAKHGFCTVSEYLQQYPGAATVRARRDSPETLERKRKARSGKTHSAETKAKIGAKHRGKTRTAEEIDKWRVSYRNFLNEHGSPMLGKDRGTAFKQKMSLIALARPQAMIDAKVQMMQAARRGSKATPEQRARYSEARLKYMRENPDKLPSKLFDTKPEREFKAELDTRGIPYSRNKQIKGKLFDFCLNDKILVEIDGPYHWNFKMYGNQSMTDEERIALFEEAKKNDILKNKIATSSGYQIYRIKVCGNLPEDWYKQLLSQGFDLF